MAATQLSDKNDEGTVLGQSTSDLIAFHGDTPTSQRAAAILTATSSLWALTGASYVANTSTTVSGLFGFNSTLASQLFDSLQEIRTMLVDYGLHKGGA
jgi:hypothetical protein